MPDTGGEPPMKLLPLRLTPGMDLRRALEAIVTREGFGAGFVICGIDKAADARLRLADAPEATLFPGPFEILTLAGSLTPQGAHLHASVSAADGSVIGGHGAYGNEVRTTVELLLVDAQGWDLRREFDAATGFDELVVRRRDETS